MKGEIIMAVTLNNTEKYHLAKSLTELAIQNDLIEICEDSTETAKAVSNFFDTLINTIGNSINLD